MLKKSYSLNKSVLGLYAPLQLPPHLLALYFYRVYIIKIIVIKLKFKCIFPNNHSLQRFCCASTEIMAFRLRITALDDLDPWCVEEGWYLLGSGSLVEWTYANQETTRRGCPRNP